MEKHLHDLWIISKSGLVIFEKVKNEQIAPDLFGAMINVLNLYAEKLSEGGISSFNFKDNQFVMIRKSSLIFVTRTSKEFDIKLVKKELKKIAKRFLKQFSEEAVRKSNGGNMDAFSSFKKELTNE